MHIVAKNESYSYPCSGMNLTTGSCAAAKQLGWLQNTDLATPLELSTMDSTFACRRSYRITSAEGNLHVYAIAILCSWAVDCVTGIV